MKVLDIEMIDEEIARKNKTILIFIKMNRVIGWENEMSRDQNNYVLSRHLLKMLGYEELSYVKSNTQK